LLRAVITRAAGLLIATFWKHSSMAQALRRFQKQGNGVFGCMWLDKFKVKQTKHPFWEKRWGSVWQKAAKGGTKKNFWS